MLAPLLKILTHSAIIEKNMNFKPKFFRNLFSPAAIYPSILPLYINPNSTSYKQQNKNELVSSPLISNFFM